VGKSIVTALQWRSAQDRPPRAEKIRRNEMAGMQEFHHIEETRDKTSKIVAWVVIALLLGGFGVYVAESGFFSPSSSATNYPRAL
jgi:hypothetical protein